VLTSAVAAVATFLVAALAAGCIFLVAAVIFDTWSPSGQTTREFMAYSGLALIIGAGYIALVIAALKLAPHFAANAWLTMAIAGLLTGLVMHPLLFYVSFMHDCTLGVQIPYDVTICSDG
jgi:hypothetical protein